LAEKYCDPQVE
jgi:hypothetical protein